MSAFVQPTHLTHPQLRRFLSRLLPALLVAQHAIAQPAHGVHPVRRARDDVLIGRHNHAQSKGRRRSGYVRRVRGSELGFEPGDTYIARFVCARGALEAARGKVCHTNRIKGVVYPLRAACMQRSTKAGGLEPPHSFGGQKAICGRGYAEQAPGSREGWAAHPTKVPSSFRVYTLHGTRLAEPHFAFARAHEKSLRPAIASARDRGSPHRRTLNDKHTAKQPQLSLRRHSALYFVSAPYKQVGFSYTNEHL